MFVVDKPAQDHHLRYVILYASSALLLLCILFEVLCADQPDQGSILNGIDKSIAIKLELYNWNLIKLNHTKLELSPTK